MPDRDDRFDGDLGVLVAEGPEPLGVLVTPTDEQTKADDPQFDPYTLPDFEGD